MNLRINLERIAIHTTYQGCSYWCPPCHSFVLRKWQHYLLWLRCHQFHYLPLPFTTLHIPFSSDFLPLYLPNGPRIWSLSPELLLRFTDPPLTLCVICHHSLSTALPQVKSYQFSCHSLPKANQVLNSSLHSFMPGLPASYQGPWFAIVPQTGFPIYTAFLPAATMTEMVISAIKNAFPELEWTWNFVLVKHYTTECHALLQGECFHEHSIYIGTLSCLSFSPINVFVHNAYHCMVFCFFVCLWLMLMLLV